MPRAKKPAQPETTARQLGSIVKSARQIMRKDKGLSGELDRLPILTWVMFLKFLDDLEQLRETEAVLQGKAFQPAIDPPYRWRDWAALEGGITGDELIAFINQEQAVLPDGSQGPGLFAYLRNLQGARDANGARGDRRDVITTVFKGLQNRMLNGYLLRDVIDKINGIHFNSSEEMHTLSRLYETMLREMRDAAGDSGEFYTPRPVVRFMVEVTDPKLGETILDPACGVMATPPDALLGQSVAGKVTKDGARWWLDAELDRVFPRAEFLINEMKLEVRFKDVTYETLNRDDFLRSVKEAFPSVDWDNAYAQFRAAAEERAC